MVRIHLHVPCRPTESVAKVKTAVLNLFPDAVFSREHDELEAESTSIERLRERIRAQKIRDSARGALLAGLEGTRLRFRLNKQAAYMGKVSFAADSPLGDLDVEIEDGDLDGLVDDIAESTTRPPPRPLGD